MGADCASNTGMPERYYLWPYYAFVLARRKLKIEPEYDFILAGIASPLQDYRLAWSLNKTLFKSLEKTNDLMLSDSENRMQMHFSVYVYSEELTRSLFYLIQQKHAQGFLMPEIKEMDYLLLIKGGYYRSRVKGMMRRIMQIDQVQAAVVLDVQTLRSRTNLVLDDALYIKYDDE